VFLVALSEKLFAPLLSQAGYGPPYRYQQCNCLAALPAKMSVFNSHMQAAIQ